MRRLPLLLLVAIGACTGKDPAPVAPEAETGPDAAADPAADTDTATDTAADVATDGPAESSADAAAGTLRVLFIGNSYVFTNDLPAVLRAMAATAGEPPTIETAEVLVGGATLQNHWTTGTAPARIDDKTWTHVVLQGQSVEPLWQPAVFQKYAASFGERVVAAGARPTWFATWARGEGDATYAETWSGGTPSAMQDALTAAYAKAAAAFSTSVLARVGEAFRKVRAERPALALLVDDKSHPTLAGTYLAACTFYLAMVGKPVPAASKPPAGLPATDATYLCAVPPRL